MLFTTKIATTLLAIAASAVSVRSAVVERSAFYELSVVFFDDVNLNGASFSPDNLVEGECNTLPGDWLNRAQSVFIGPQFSCTFYTFQGCEGEGKRLDGVVLQLPDYLYDNIESFFCHKV